MNLPAQSQPFAPPDLAVGWTQRTAAWLATHLSHLYFGLEVSGLEHLPAGESCLVCANHASHVDTFALACATGADSQRLVFLAARDYFFAHRWRSGLLRRLICILPFERRAGIAGAKHNLRLFAACREAKRLIVFFPEGTRSRDGRMSKVKPGVAMFADKLGLRVVPCRIEGSYESLPKGRWFPRPSPLRLTFGHPLAIDARAGPETPAAREERYLRFADELQSVIASLGEPSPPNPAVASA